jgi:3-oxoacyl-[acyl-carrier protein] reductase
MTFTNQEALSGKTALVTGASRAIGIGAAITRELARFGASVFFTTYLPYDADMPWGSNAQDAEELQQELSQLGVQCAFQELDLVAYESFPAFFDQVEQEVGAVHILVNNATYSVNGDLAALTAVSLDQHYAVNVRGMALLTQEFVHRYHQHELDYGRIINMSSGQGVTPMPGELAYAASKGAVEAFTVSLSAELAAAGITVNAVDPGATDTGWMSEELKAQITAQTPMERVGLPEDAARLVAFLASPAASWITGQVIHSRGGF